jgi:hypothetical protein
LNGETVCARLKFDFPSSPNYVFVEYPDEPYVLDCTNIKQVITRRIQVTRGKIQRRSLLELLVPPKEMTKSAVLASDLEYKLCT